MNKAFTKETDKDDDDDGHEPEDSLPLSTKNYVTPEGFSALQTELRYLVSEERPKLVVTVKWAASNGDRSENGDYIYGKRRMREIDRRVRYLTKRLENAEIVDPKRQVGLSQVFFGATVTYKKNKKTHTVKIVGIDEADVAKNKISWLSPLARALLKGHEGDIVEFKTPSGRSKIEIISIEY